MLHVNFLDTNLWEVPNHMSSKLVNFAEDIKEKWFNIKVECLVIQEQLCYQT